MRWLTVHFSIGAMRSLTKAENKRAATAPSEPRHILLTKSRTLLHSDDTLHVTHFLSNQYNKTLLLRSLWWSIMSKKENRSRYVGTILSSMTSLVVPSFWLRTPACSNVILLILHLISLWLLWTHWLPLEYGDKIPGKYDWDQWEDYLTVTVRHMASLALYIQVLLYWEYFPFPSLRKAN